VLLFLVVVEAWPWMKKFKNTNEDANTELRQPLNKQGPPDQVGGPREGNAQNLETSSKSNQPLEHCF
jgi:hypothetical protein